jgi:hypothetical protein
VVECVETTRSYQSIPCDLYVLLDDEGMTFLPMKLAMHPCMGAGPDMVVARIRGNFVPWGQMLCGSHSPDSTCPNSIMRSKIQLILAI